MRPPLNCWLVALWLWFASRGRALIWMRRSQHFSGLIPHSGTAHHGGWRRMYLVEYIPLQAERRGWRSFGVLFRGRYRVWEFRAVRVRSFTTMSEAQAHLIGRVKA